MLSQTTHHAQVGGITTLLKVACFVEQFHYNFSRDKQLSEAHYAVYWVDIAGKKNKANKYHNFFLQHLSKSITMQHQKTKHCTEPTQPNNYLMSSNAIFQVLILTR